MTEWEVGIPLDRVSQREFELPVSQLSGAVWMDEGVGRGASSGDKGDTFTISNSACTHAVSDPRNVRCWGISHGQLAIAKQSRRL